LPRYEVVICVSDDLRQRCLASGVPASRCVLVENGIDTAEFARQDSVANAKKRLGVPSERSLIGAAGRLSPEKGFDILLRAAAQLRQKGADLELWIVGEGDDRPRLQALIAELGAASWARLLGYRADLRAIYQALDVFALSSFREGLPNVLLEAMALEVLVVATEIAGIPRLIRDGENGLLVPPGAVDGLAQALARVLANRRLTDQFRLAGRRTIAERYSFAARMSKIRAIYDDLLRPQRSGQRARCLAFSQGLMLFL
jgi:glycosyltransferase involved in cell wall biosynthesis